VFPTPGRSSDTDQLMALRAAAAQGSSDAVLQISEAVLATATDPSVVVETATVRAGALTQIGRMPEALSLLRASRDRLKAANHLTASASLCLAKAGLATSGRDAQAAAGALVEAANDFGLAGDTADQIRAEVQLAMLNAMASQVIPARQILDACLAAARQLGDAEVLAEVLHNQGVVLRSTGADPLPVFEEGLQVVNAAAGPLPPGSRIQLQVDVASAAAGRDPGRANSLLQEAQRAAAALPEPLAAATALAIVAQGWFGISCPLDGAHCGDQGLQVLRNLGAGPQFIGLAASLSDLCRAAGRQADADRYLNEALAVSAPLGVPGEANVMMMLGQAAMQRGDRQAAQGAFGEAARRLKAVGLPLPPQLVAILGNLGVTS
jgi:tetratricopeptide (TPR) repeat protein